MELFNFKDDYNLLEFMNQVKSINPIINYYINNNYKYLENFEYDTGDDLDPVNSIFMLLVYPLYLKYLILSINLIYVKCFIYKKLEYKT